MLTHINIKKFLYMEDISVELVKGLNVFTGETGVGKSLVVDAVEFAFGSKGNFDENSSVEVVFEDVRSEYSDDGILIVSREIRNGKSIYYLNGRRSTLSTVKEAVKDVLEIHGQHHSQKLLDKNYHRVILDKYAGLDEDIKEYQELYYKYLELSKKEKELIEMQSKRLQEMDLLKYQLEELESADLKEGEKEELEEKFRYLNKINEINESITKSLINISEEENSILDKLSQVIKDIQKISDTHTEFKNILENLEEAKVLMSETLFSLSNFDLEIDEEEIRKVEERLNLINRLELKYNTDEKGLIILKEQIRSKIENLENLEDQIHEIKNQKEFVYKSMVSKGEEISKKRKEFGEKLSSEVEEHLKDLALKDAKFLVVIKDKDYDKFGKDDVRFYFSGNKGLDPKPIEDTASGGEISRVSLSLKLVTGSDVDCMIFDEIDAGIGGKTAVLIAEKIYKLSQKYQIILVTHLPQVAVYADRHIFIDKISGNNKTESLVKVIDGEERKKEIARMLAGVINKKSLQLAEDLLTRIKT